jgi:predicted nucleotidyltransferase component of viral defense system
MNPAIKKMLEKYSCANRIDYERAIKEIIQEIALVGLWRSKFFEHAAFYGGTSLRILYDLDRFSEDMDFTLLQSNLEFSLDKYNDGIVRELVSYGFSVDVDTKSKSWNPPIRSAFIKANTLGEIIKVGVPTSLTRGLHPETTLKIKVEVDTDPAPAYDVETVFLQRPVSVGVRSVVIKDMYAGKMHALLFRQWKGRVKGRDWYDWLWFMRQNIPLDLDRLAIHMKKGSNLDKEESLTPEIFEEMMRNKIESLDLESAKQDMFAFAQDQQIIATWSKELFLQMILKMNYL